VTRPLFSVELVWPENQRNAALVAMSAWVANRVAKRP
jgi:hypothetical protein